MKELKEVIKLLILLVIAGIALTYVIAIGLEITLINRNFTHMEAHGRYAEVSLGFIEKECTGSSCTITVSIPVRSQFGDVIITGGTLMGCKLKVVGDTIIKEGEGAWIDLKCDHDLPITNGIYHVTLDITVRKCAAFICREVTGKQTVTAISG